MKGDVLVEQHPRRVSSCGWEMEDATIWFSVWQNQAASIFLKDETDVFYNEVYIIVIFIIIIIFIIITIIIIMCFSIFSTRSCLSKSCQMLFGSPSPNGRSLFEVSLPCVSGRRRRGSHGIGFGGQGSTRFRNRIGRWKQEETLRVFSRRTPGTS